MSLLELLSLAPFRRALLALAATGLAFPALGTFILALELVPARFAVMHASLLGAAVGLALGLPALPVALAASILAGAGVARLSERSGSAGGGGQGNGGASASGPLGLVMTLSLGLALILFHVSDVNAVEAFDLFWGSILALSRIETGLLLAGSGIALLLVALFRNEIRAVLFDRELAAAMGVPARATHYGLIILICMGVALAMRVTGALMVDAVTILPALAARSLRKGLVGTLIAGSLIGVGINFAGFAAATLLDLPASPAIIVLGSLVVLCAGFMEKSAKKREGRKAGSGSGSRSGTRKTDPSGG